MSIEKRLYRYIAPNIIAMIGTSCYVLADTFFISIAAGSNGITALNLVLPIYGFMFAIGSMIGVGSATRYAISKAEGQNNYNDYFSNSIFFTLIISIIFILCGIFFANEILTLLGADETIKDVGLDYLKIVLCFAPLFMVNYTFTTFVRNDGSPRIAMSATLISGIFNIVFDYILMFPLNLGMIGAALATAFSPIVSISICFIHLLSKKNTIKFIWKTPSIHKLFYSCKLGVVAFVGEMSSGITTMVFNYLLLALSGNIAVAAYGVIANTSLVGMALFNGVSLGLQPLASECHGKGLIEDEKRIYRKSLLISFIISIILVAIIMIFAEDIIGIFNTENSTALLEYAQKGIRLYFIGFLLASINIVTAGFFSATGKEKESSIIALLRGVVAIIFFSFVLSSFLDITGVWLAFASSELFTLFVSLFFLLRKNRKENM